MDLGIIGSCLAPLPDPQREPGMVETTSILVSCSVIGSVVAYRFMPIQIRTEHLKRRRTKIMATLGPASSEPAVIESLITAGVDVFRLNMSHGDHEGHRRLFERVRTCADEAECPITIVADLSGPKIRCGRFRDGAIDLEEGSEVIVTTREVVGEPGLIPSQYEALAQDVKPGDPILLDDGNLELRVLSVEGTEIRCRVVHGGPLKDRKGINLPGVVVSAPSLTEKDREDALFALELGVDFLALSFVRRASDVRDLRALINSTEETSGIIAKIEKPEALGDIEAILEASDGIMVARGDLGVELPPEAVPIAQSQLVNKARNWGKPVIVATQMLESMIEHARPTRAEVTDVSNAVMSGADAIMLSAETASGAHPVRVVEVMDRIAREAEGYLWKTGAFGSIRRDEEAIERPLPLGLAIARSTAQLSRDLLVRAIVVFSSTGTSGRMMSSARPAAPMLALCPSLETYRRMNLLWGVVPVHVEPSELEDPNELARYVVTHAGLAEKGDYILRVSGFHLDPDKTNPTIAVLPV